MNLLLKKSKDLRPCVVGLGKLGLPLVAVLAKNGFQVSGIDKNLELIHALSKEEFNYTEPNLKQYLKKYKKNIIFKSNFSELKTENVFFIIVPTPSTDDGQFSNDFVLDALHSLLESFKNQTGDKTIVIVSTVMPGSCETKFHPLINKWLIQNNSDLKINLIYSPEFIALGSVIFNLENPDMTLVGCKFGSDADDFLAIMNEITNKKCETQLLSWNEAEVVKLLVNCFVTMKISFANFVGEIGDQFANVNPYKVANALGTDSRIGSKYLRPGLGFAGPCFPRDNIALVKFAEDIGLSADLAKSTDKINSRLPLVIAKKILKEYPNVKKIGIFGIAYKPHTNVIEKSQSLEIARILKENNKELFLVDPLVSPKTISEFDFSNQLDSLDNCDLIIAPYEFSKLPIFQIKSNQELYVI